MAILKVARMGNPVLARKADPVADPTAPAVKRLVADMIDTMADASGAGLAAPQVQVPLRVVVFQAPQERAEPDHSEAERFEASAPLTVLINPEIAVLDPTLEGGWEGCLSVPDLRGWVERPRRIRYRGVTPEGHAIVREASGFHAREAQHECDHLDGVLYVQRMRDMTKFFFESELRHWVACERQKEHAQ